MLRRLKHRLRRLARPQWEYKVVQLVAQAPEDPEKASRKLGGRLSPEALRDQFPEHYSGGNGRQQIQDFLNRLGADGWELLESATIGGLPLMVFKRLAQEQNEPSGAKTEADPRLSDHVSTRD